MVSSTLIKFVLLAAIIGCAYSVGIYEQCAGEGYGTFPCAAGLTCFRRNKWYSSCQFECPRNQGWDCEIYFPPGPIPIAAAAWDQCGGDGWVGPRICAVGFACYARSASYSQCRPINDCPPGWACPGVVATTTAAPVVVPIIIPAYSKCNGIANANCIGGTACYKNTDLYSECRPSCPPTWACETEYVGLGAQCGGAGYTGITRCAPGLRCYVRNQYYAHCAVSCPGADWIC